jgi:hypothetical protein
MAGGAGKWGSTEPEANQLSNATERHIGYLWPTYRTLTGGSWVKRMISKGATVEVIHKP